MAFLFDLNGTMVDDMNYHIKAWHKIINDLGYPISLERAKDECYGKNSELLERMFPGRFSEEEKYRMGFEKEKIYQQEFKPELKLLPGLDTFLREAQAKNIKMAIGSAAIMYNIDFVIDNTDTRNLFGAIVSADHVANSKPDPETWLKCAVALGIDTSECIVFEDSPKGVESAYNAGMKCVVVNSLHEKHEFQQQEHIIKWVKDYREVQFYELV